MSSSVGFPKIVIGKNTAAEAIRPGHNASILKIGPQPAASPISHRKTTNIEAIMLQNAAAEVGFFQNIPATVGISSMAVWKE